jgi:hypothetical protein
MKSCCAVKSQLNNGAIHVQELMLELAWFHVTAELDVVATK